MTVLWHRPRLQPALAGKESPSRHVQLGEDNYYDLWPKMPHNLSQKFPTAF